MIINANGLPVVISGETIISCPKQCNSNLWANKDTGALYCPKCNGGK